MEVGTQIRAKVSNARGVVIEPGQLGNAVRVKWYSNFQRQTVNVDDVEELTTVACPYCRGTGFLEKAQR